MASGRGVRNKTVCNELLANLEARGLSSERARLFVIDGGKGIRAAILAHFGRPAIIQRCRAHKRRNVTDHLPEGERSFLGKKLDRAWGHPDARPAEAELRALAKSLTVKHQGVAASVLEGLEETLAVTRLGLPPALLKTFKSTNPIESMISVGRTVTRNVKRWRNGKMALRWTAAGMLEAEKQFRRIRGYRDLPFARERATTARGGDQSQKRGSIGVARRGAARNSTIIWTSSSTLSFSA